MTSPRRLLQWLVFATCAAVALPIAMASLMRAMDLTELTTSADQIVVGDVVSTECTWDSGHRNIYSTIEISVQESWKGSVPNDGRISIRQLGGTVGEIEMTVHGMAQFTRGERALLFLRQAHVVGMGQGKRHVQWDPGHKRWLADSQESLDVTQAGRKANPRTGDTRQPEDLNQLREKVRALVRN
jgi:hypothetical protein